MKKKEFLKYMLFIPALLSIGLAGCSNTIYPSSEISQTIISVDPAKPVVTYVGLETAVYSSTAEVVNAVADSVVEIRTESVTTRWGQQYVVSGAGSGVIVGNSDDVYYIVTNNHVIEGANEITVTTRSGVSYEASLVATDDSEDIAVVIISTTDVLKIAVWGDSDELQVGEDLIAIGNPLGSLGGTVTKGILSAKGRKITIDNYQMTLLQTDTAINPGNSGGGLFNMRGQLIGIVNAKTSDEEIEGICFAIPGNKAKKCYEDLIEKGYIVGRASFDLTLSTVSTSTSTIVYVSLVGEKASNNFSQYDYIYKINGTEITSVLSFNIVMNSLTPGEEVDVVVYRGKVTTSMWGGQISFEKTPTEFKVTVGQYGA